MKEEKRKHSFVDQTNALIHNSSETLVSFRQFIFAPNLLTFVISVVVGNSIGSMVKDLVNFVIGLGTFLYQWAFYAGHPLNPNYFINQTEPLLGSFFSMLIVAAVVFYSIQFINDKLIRTESEKWGFDQYHTDMLEIQKIQKRNVELQVENAKLQGQVLEQLKALNKNKD
ncbi:MscL family protein [Eupransor demetentiae]|uniref:Large-conductance mechanosensitive channel (MscL) n=1 Tax=Eupransor demetentiae TaxID=3109584 RepID=A0ABM9N553_9LACO|nr:Large-conductance mechanosensitive channel (MscL) [Lactobacillaceae bacterium LMG 33000]